jgi:sulfatase modifying factor 1
VGKIGGFVVCVIVGAACGDNLPPPRICSALPPTCGPMGTSSCCESPIVPGGMFYRSYDGAADGWYTDTSHPATVSTFRLDQYEVTVGRFRQFVDAGMGTQLYPPAAGAGAHPRTPGSGWNPSWSSSLAVDTTALLSGLNAYGALGTWTDAADANENLPMNCISWYEAFAFCAWDGGFLPTEAEWNYAADGGNEQRAYSWSSPASSLTIDCSYANYLCDLPTAKYSRVGSYSPQGDGKWGHADLGGNVSEWTLDSYENPYAITQCADCADMTVDLPKVYRGGDYYDYDVYLRGAYRLYRPPADRGFPGVRCARAP